MTLLWAIVKFINGCVLALLLAQSIVYLWQLVVAFLELRQHRRRASRADPWWMLTSGVALPSACRRRAISGVISWPLVKIWK